MSDSTHYKGNAYSWPDRRNDDAPRLNDIGIKFKYKFCSRCAAPMIEALREHRRSFAGFDPTTGLPHSDYVWTSRIWRCSNFTDCRYATPYESYSNAVCDCNIERHDSYWLASIEARPAVVRECALFVHEWTEPGQLSSSNGGPYRACKKCGKPEERKALIWSLFTPWEYRCHECSKRWFQYGTVRGSSRQVYPHCGAWKGSTSYGRLVGSPEPTENTLVVGIPHDESMPLPLTEAEIQADANALSRP